MGPTGGSAEVGRPATKATLELGAERGHETRAFPRQLGWRDCHRVQLFQLDYWIRERAERCGKHDTGRLPERRSLQEHQGTKLDDDLGDGGCFGRWYLGRESSPGAVFSDCFHANYLQGCTEDSLLCAGTYEGGSYPVMSSGSIDGLFSEPRAHAALTVWSAEATNTPNKAPNYSLAGEIDTCSLFFASSIEPRGVWLGA